MCRNHAILCLPISHLFPAKVAHCVTRAFSPWFRLTKFRYKSCTLFASRHCLRAATARERQIPCKSCTSRVRRQGPVLRPLLLPSHFHNSVAKVAHSSRAATARSGKSLVHNSGQKLHIARWVPRTGTPSLLLNFHSTIPVQKLHIMRS